jgi:hypothetical protein
MRHSWLLERLTAAGLRDVSEEPFHDEDEECRLVRSRLGELNLHWLVARTGNEVLSSLCTLLHLRQDRPPTEAEVADWIEAARRIGRSHSDLLSIYFSGQWWALWRGEPVALSGVEAELADVFFKGDDLAGSALWDRLEETASVKPRRAAERG